MNDYINLSIDNIECEHLCCAISDKKHQDGVDLKKQWLNERIKEGHVFRKLNVQGKVFIEYAPLEKAWVSVCGNNFLYIYCLWVAGSYKGNGYGKELLEYAISDAKSKNKNGLCVITSKKKKPFLSDKKFFMSFGFEVVDSVGDYELLSLSFNGEQPKFSDNAKKMEINNKNLTIYYTFQCPYTNDCILQLKEYSKEKGIDLDVIRIDTLEKAKAVPCIFNNWAIFKDGKYLSNSLMNKNIIDKFYK